MRTITLLSATLLLGALIRPVNAQQPWSALPGGCASTDNNFYYGVPSIDYPVARFKVPGGAFTFNGFHDGYIAVICNVDNPRLTGVTSALQLWNQLQVTYRDPDGLQKQPNGPGTEYQAYVQLVRVSKTTGAFSAIATYDSNLQCAGPTSCLEDSTVKNFTLNFSHSFDFNSYTYGVYVRLYRALATFSLSPAVYQVRLQAAQLVSSTGENAP